MLFIKFEINDLAKFADFQKVYTHMLYTRQGEFESKEAEIPDVDWDTLGEDEIKAAIDNIYEADDQEKQALDRYKSVIPDYADHFLASYASFEQQKHGIFGFEKLAIFNYLEYSFEVNMDHLEKLNENKGIVKFSTGNYPFGGLERFLIVLKAFDLRPIECFNGFSILALEWSSSFEYKTLELVEKTKMYLKK